MMEGTSQRGLEGFSEIPSEPETGRQEHSCAECRNLNCHSIHGPVVWRFSIDGYSNCTDLARIGDEISTTYKHLSDLVRERIITVSRHDMFIHRLPVELLCSIFMFVKDAIIDFKFLGYGVHDVPRPPYRQPSQSPPLLVGAVCKQWREITLKIPCLWTDIIVDLTKCADGQSNMITNWARRAGALPLDLTIFLEKESDTEEMLSEKVEEDLSEVEDVLSALKTVSAQWNEVAFRVPASFCYRLFSNLEETPPIGTLFLNEVDGYLMPVKLQHPLRPRRLETHSICSKNIPFECDRLVFVYLANVCDGEVLHVIRHAQNLQKCTVIGCAGTFEDPDFPIPTSPITSRSLTHFKTWSDIIGYLTLPSLLYLDNEPSESLIESFDSLVDFVDRSRPPLHELILRWYIPPERPFPSFEKLPEITSVILDIDDEERKDFSKTDDFLHALIRPSVPAILPRLNQLSIHLTNSSASWSLFSQLFPKDTISPDLEASLEHSVALRRPLSRVDVFILDNAVTINKDTFLHLVGVQKSGVSFTIVFRGNPKFDFFQFIAQIYDVELNY